MNKREFKEKVYTGLAAVTKALASPHRLEIVELLAQGDYSVEQIALQTGLSVANASRHLQVLKAAQLVDISRNGNFIHYRLAGPDVFRAWKALRELGVERIAAVGKLVADFRNSRHPAKSITIRDLVKKVKTGKVTVLDVRPEPEFRAGHIPAAVSIPVDELRRRMKELRKGHEIVAYCRGPFCAYADEAVAILNKAGFKAMRLEEGFPDWSLLGLPVSLN